MASLPLSEFSHALKNLISRVTRIQNQTAQCSIIATIAIIAIIAHFLPDLEFPYETIVTIIVESIIPYM